MTKSTRVEGNDAATVWQRDEERLRRRFQQLREDLVNRDREAERDPWAFQRWPRERKVYADRVDQAREGWESHVQRAEFSDESRSRSSTNLEHEAGDESPS